MGGVLAMPFSRAADDVSAHRKEYTASFIVKMQMLAGFQSASAVPPPLLRGSDAHLSLRSLMRWLVCSDIR